MKTFFVISLLCLLLGTAYSLTNYQHNFNTLTTNVPYYNLGYIYLGTSIQINITLPGITSIDLTDLTIELFPTGNPGGVLTADSTAPAVIAGSLTIT